MRVDWKDPQIAWHLPNGMLAEMFGVTEITVSKARVRLGKPRSTITRARKIPWEDVAWSELSNSEVAALTGCRLTHVSSMRRRHAPETRQTPGRKKVKK